MRRSVLIQPHKPRRAFVVVLGLAILALALMGHMNAVDSHHGVEHACHHHTCWMLTPEPTVPAVLGLVWFSSVFRFVLLREHVFLVFKPPRLHTLSIHP